MGAIDFFQREAGTAGVLNSAEFIAQLTHSLVLNRGTGSATFTRATTKTVMGYGPTANSSDSQVLLTYASGEAAFEGARRISEGVWSNTFADGTLIPASTLKGITIHAAATNLCLQSNAFTTTWTASNLSVLTQNATGPDGATSAWTATDSVSGVNSFISQTVALTSGNTYTYSFFVKKTTGAQASYPVMLTNFSTTGAALCTVDTSNGVATVWTALTGFTIVTSSASCVSYNDSFWRVSLTFTANATNTWTFILYPAGTTNATQSTGTTDQSAQGSAVFYGAQVELGSVATPYIPTTTAAATRNADVLTFPSSGNVDGTVGWCYAEGSGVNTSVARVLDTGNDFEGLLLNSSGSLAIFDGTTLTTDGAISSTVTNKMASTWGGSTQIVCANGATPTSGSFDGNIVSHTSIAIGGLNTHVINGTIRNVRIAQRKLSASELQAITGN